MLLTYYELLFSGCQVNSVKFVADGELVVTGSADKVSLFFVVYFKFMSVLINFVNLN